MALLLKDCGLEGFKGSVERCDACDRATVHFRRPGRRPVCGICGVLVGEASGREALGYRTRRVLDGAHQ